MKLTPKPIVGRPGYCLKFRHPLQDMKVVSLGLATQDKGTADAYCADAERLFDAVAKDPTLLNDRKDYRLTAYLDMAVQIVLGADTANNVKKVRTQPPVLDQSDVTTLRIRIINALDEAADLSRSEIEEMIEQILAGYESRRYIDLQIEFQKLELQSKTWRSAADELERLRRKHNVHVKVTVCDAVAEWKKAYPDGRARVTVVHAFSSVDSFLRSLPAGDRTPLATIKAGHIDSWLTNLTTTRVIADGEKVPQPIGQVMKRKCSAYLSSFFTWAIRKYDLSENPFDRTGKLSGVSRNPENILAIRRLTDMQGFFTALEPFQYWHAWCAVACLAGPRWSEQAWMKIDDVYLDENQIRVTSRSSGRKITGTKTGRERSIPIEQTVLKRILANHVARRKKEQKSGTSDAARSQWLFPSAVGINPHRPHVKSEVGMWSGISTFADAWHKCREKAKRSKIGKTLTAEVWTFGPSEWRHTFGTALGHAGWTSREIANCMGNSSLVAERHYIAPGKGGVRWPFKW